MNLTGPQLAQRRTNVANIAATRRAQTTCKYGHDLTPANTMLRGDGRRVCRVCDRDRGWYRYHGIRWAR